MKLQLLFLFLVGICCASCSKDDPEPAPEKYPITLNFTEIDHWADFTLYKGSTDGGVRVNTDGMNPREIWEGRVDVNPKTLVFLNDSEVQIDGSDDLGWYKISNDSIFFMRSWNREDWNFVATGNLDRMIYHLGFSTMTKKEEGSYFFDIGQDTNLRTYDDLFWQYTPADLTNVLDRVAWCNIYYKFERKIEK